MNLIFDSIISKPSTKGIDFIILIQNPLSRPPEIRGEIVNQKWPGYFFGKRGYSSSASQK